MAFYSSSIPPPMADETRTRTSVHKSSTDGTTADFDTNGTPNLPPLSLPIEPQAETSRTCRICFESVHPEVDSKTGRTIYGGDDSEEGHLIRPCGCKGSQKYVHELCLKAYRHYRPLEASYLTCPTCGVGYRFNDSLYTRIATHALTHACVTGLAIFAAILVAGYAAVPLLSITTRYRQNLQYGMQIVSRYEQDRGWLGHFVLGTWFVGLWGLFFVPWDFFQMLRTGAVPSPIVEYLDLAVSTSHQSRSWVPVLNGVARVVYWIWCEIGVWVRRYIEKDRGRVMDLDDHGNQ
jgi:hypothetical protein